MALSVVTYRNAPVWKDVKAKPAEYDHAGLIDLLQNLCAASLAELREAMASHTARASGL